MTLPRSRPLLVAAALAALFGIATIVAGGRVLFGPDAARAAAGRYLPAVVWFNFLAGFAYVAAAVGLARGSRWGATLSLAIAGATAIVLLGFAVWTLRGGPHEPRTAAVLPLRTAFWAVLGAWALRRPRPGRGNP